MADNEERLVLSADTARLKRGVESAAKTLQQLSSLTGKTNTELTTLETKAQRAATSLKNLSKTQSGKNPFAGWSKEAQVVLQQLRELEKQQKKVNDRKVGAATLPASLSGRNSAGQFTARDVKNLKDSELKQISDTIENKEMSLSRAVAQETARRKKLRQDEATAAQRAAKQVADAAARAARAEQDAARAIVRAQHDREQAMISGRYALYDISTTYLATAAGIAAAGVITIKTAADFESAFTNVERTSDRAEGSLGGLKQSLIDLSTSTPTSFGDIAQIASLGNQLGISEGAILSFTKSVQQFALISGMSVEATATAFGSLGTLLNLQESDFDRLGSAIALVARTSVATEEEVVALSTRLAASATNAGFTAQEVIGLSGAMASLRIAPERAQGVMEVYFAQLNGALAEGGDKMQLFADVSRMSTDQMQKLIQTDPASFFREFSAGLGSLDSVTRTQALDALGLAGIRAGEVFGRVASNLDEYDNALANTNKGYEEQSEMARQQAMVLNDLNSQFGILVNSVMALFAAIGGTGGAGLPELIGNISAVVQGLTAWVQSPLGEWITRILAYVAGAIGAFVAYRGAMALATAATFAFTSAQILVARTGAANGLMGLIGVMRNYRLATGGAAAASAAMAGGTAAAGTAAAVATPRVAMLAAAMRRFVTATVVLAAIGGVIHVMSDLRAHVLSLAPVADFVAETFANMVHVILTTASQVAGAFSFLPGIGGDLKRVSGLYSDMAARTGDLADMSKKAWRDMANMLPTVGEETEDYTAKNIDMANSWNDAGEALDMGSDSLDGVGDSAAGAAEEVRTLVDYANDLQGVFTRAFDIRFGATEALDGITKSFSTMRQATADTAREIRTLKADIQGLTADKRILEYFRTIANEYGDTLRAGEINADIAKINADLADKNKDLTAAQKKNSKSLKGNSDAAVDNRSALRDIARQYEDYIVQLAESGMSQADLSRETERLRGDFIRQATQMGYSRREVEVFARAFDDMRVSIANVPRNITVSANANPALQALAEFRAQLKSTRASAGKGISIPAKFGGVDIPNFTPLGQIAGKEFKNGFKQYANGAFVVTDSKGAMVEGWFGKGAMRFLAAGGLAAQGSTKPLAMARGGMVPGTPPARHGVDNVPAMLRSREFVMTEDATRHYGPDFFHMLNRMQLPRFAAGGSPSSSAGRASTPSTMVVELSAYDRHLLARAGNVQLSIGGEQIARVVGGENVNSFRRGRG